MASLLILTKKADITQQVSHLTQTFSIEFATNKELALQKFSTKKHDFLLIDAELLSSPSQEVSYKKNLSPFWQISANVQIIILCQQSNLREAVNLVKAGANNYIMYPLNPTEIQHILHKSQVTMQLKLELDYLRDKFWKPESIKLIQTQSEKVKKMFHSIKAVAPTKTTVLLSGETGVGKGVLARIIHNHSNRSHLPFVSVHCGAIPDTLIESELFGHEKGSFTGAVKRKLGKFEIANGGTIFLDEIGTVTTATQIKLLKVLQDRIFQRVGGEQDVEVDVRIVAATNDNLQQMVENGTFRKDLLYRLNIFPISIPALRERKEDIPNLIEGYLQKLNRFYDKNIYEVHPTVLQTLTEYSWPGNIRELENLIERAFILETSSILTPESFPSELFKSTTEPAAMVVDTSKTLAEVRTEALENIERQYLQQILSIHKGKISKTAETAGVGPRQLHKLLTKYGIRKEEFK